MKKKQDIENHNLDELFERYRKAPDSYVFVPLADACRKTGQIEEALEICGKGVERHPSYPSGHVVKGKCLFDKGDHEAAREVFRRVLSLDDGNLVALKYLGMIEADGGDLAEARRHFQQILTVDPENREIKDVLRVVEEREQIEKSKPVASDIDAVDEILGDSEPSEDKEIEPAGTGVESLNDVLEISDELASITLADIFASQGYTRKAEKIFREVLRKQPDNSVVQKRLRELSGKPGDSPEHDDVFAPSDHVDEPVAFQDAVPEPEKPEARTARTDNEPAVSLFSDDDGRPEITENDCLGHFQRWLNKIQK